MLSSNLKKRLGKLKQKKYRKMFVEYVVEGRKGVEEALKHSEVVGVVIEGSRREEEQFASIIKTVEDEEIYIEYAKSTDIDAIKSTETFPGVLAIVERPETDAYDFTLDEPVIVLDRINDPGNLGTIIRTADWFGINHIIIGEQSADPFNEKCVRATMGSISRVNILESKNLKSTLTKLKEQEYTVAGFDIEGTTIADMKPLKKHALLFGSESHGLHVDLREFIDETYTIDKFGQAESLNLAISAGIVMWQLKK